MFERLTGPAKVVMHNGQDVDLATLHTVQGNPQLSAEEILSANHELLRRHMVASKVAGCPHGNAFAVTHEGHLETFHGPKEMRGPADADASKDWGEGSAKWATSADDGDVAFAFCLWIREVCPDLEAISDAD